MKIIKNLIIKYSTFVKYIFSAGLSFALDIGLFRLFQQIFKGIFGDTVALIATPCARVISSFFNYLMNRNAVFKSGEKKADKSSLTKYYILVIIQMCISGLLVFSIHNFVSIDETIIKIPVDIVIFIINYFVQKKWIFKKQ